MELWDCGGVSADVRSRRFCGNVTRISSGFGLVVIGLPCD